MKKLFSLLLILTALAGTLSYPMMAADAAESAAPMLPEQFADHTIVTPGDTVNAADGADVSYYFGDMGMISLPEGSGWKPSYAKAENGAYMTLLCCMSSKKQSSFTVPVQITGKYSVHVGYAMGTKRFIVNGKTITATNTGDNVVRDVLVTTKTFSGEEITITNAVSAAARIAYVRFVPAGVSNEPILSESNEKNLMIDNDGYSMFCYEGINTPQALISRAVTQFAPIQVTQWNWCTFSTSILNYDSDVWWKYVTARLEELNVPKENYPENFLDHVDNTGKKPDFDHLMRDLDKYAYSNMLALSEYGKPHEILADHLTENEIGDIYVSFRMSHYNAGEYGFQCGALYYLYPEFIREGGPQLSYSHEVYRNYLHDLVLEPAAYENVAGITLDFGRYYYIFGNELTDVGKRTEIMNDFVKSVHDDMPEGKKLIVRVLNPTDQKALAWGLDYKNWVKEGWVDRVIISDQSHETFFDFTEYMEFFEDYPEVEFYLGINATLSGHDLTKAEEELRKQGIHVPSGERVAKDQIMLRAYAAYMAGADGIFFFNGLGSDPDYAFLNNKESMINWYNSLIFDVEIKFVDTALAPAWLKEYGITATEAQRTAVTTDTAAPEETADCGMPDDSEQPVTTDDPGTAVSVWLIAGILAAAGLAVGIAVGLKKRK